MAPYHYTDAGGISATDFHTVDSGESLLDGEIAM